MRLFEAIIAANHQAVAGNGEATVALGPFADALPVVALTCIDVRLNRLLPNVLGLPEEHFIWLRNAGNIITGALSSTLRSLSLACAIKGGKEIALIGHSDCKAGQTTVTQLIEGFQKLGVGRHLLPENLLEFYGLFASERQNVLRGVEIVRSSSIIGPRVPVHGLFLDLTTGRVDWVVNGYEALDSVAAKFGNVLRQAEALADAVGQLGGTLATGLSLSSAPIGTIPTAVGAAPAPPPEPEPTPEAVPPSQSGPWQWTTPPWPARQPAPSAGDAASPALPPVIKPPALPATKLAPRPEPTKPRLHQPWKRLR